MTMDPAPTDSPNPTPDDAWTDPGFMDDSIWRTDRKPRRKSLTLGIGLVILIALPFAVSRSNLLGLPDVGPPAKTAPVVAKGEFNAAELYAAAADAIPVHRISIAAPVSWTSVPSADREWLADQEAPMRLWFTATGLTRCDPTAARELTDAEILRLSRLAVLSGLRDENVGRWDEAFDWYLALLRFANHLKMRTGTRGWFASSRVHQIAAGRLLQWADFPNLGTEQLSRALEETNRLRLKSPPAVDTLRFEAERVDQAFERPDALELSRNPEAAGLWGGLTSKVSRWIRAEPEYSRRVARLILANWVDVFRVEPYPADGAGLRGEGLVLFPDRTGRVGGMRPESLIDRFRNARYARMLIPEMNNFIAGVNGDDRNQSEFVLSLAEALYRRRNGKPSAVPSDLICKELPELP